MRLYIKCGKPFIGSKGLYWMPIIDKSTDQIIKHQIIEQDGTHTRFTTLGGWGGSAALEQDGLTWQRIIDRITGQVWFYNVTEQYVRPWLVGDEKIRHGYVETNSVWRVRPVHIPYCRFDSKTHKCSCFLKRLRQFEKGVKSQYKTVMDFIRFKSHQGSRFAIQIVYDNPPSRY